MVNAPVNPTGVGTTQRNGKAYYDHQLEGATTTHITAEQVHQLGLSEVARLRTEMTALKDKAGFQGDLAAFFRFLHTDAQFKYPNTDAGRRPTSMPAMPPSRTSGRYCRATSACCPGRTWW